MYAVEFVDVGVLQGGPELADPLVEVLFFLAHQHSLFYLLAFSVGRQSLFRAVVD